MVTNKTFIYQTEQIRECEHLAVTRFGVEGYALMLRAGKAAFDYMLRRWPHAEKIAVFVGSSNNGGDGYVLAQLAHTRGLQVIVYQVGGKEPVADEARQAWSSCQQAGVPIMPLDAASDFPRPDVIVDAICGIGLKHALRQEVVTIIEKMHRVQAPIFSLDMPTGIDADTGCVRGFAVHATATMTFIGMKLGLLTGAGPSYTGELILHDLQLPPDLMSSVAPVAEKIALNQFAHYLKPRLRDWHKGLSGHVLVIGGEVGFSGAPHMAAEAALRVGAGLVTVATCKENAAMMNVGCPEIMCQGIESLEQLLPLINKANVIVIGPGLGQSAWAQKWWQHVSKLAMPLVVDADALNLLATQPITNKNWVLTPHPGEAARLLQLYTHEVQADRLGAVKAMQQRYDGVCVLKGVGSLIFSPDALPALCDKGNPGMSTAGMGDILSGVIAGLIAQGVPLGDAAKLGVCLHAVAGDHAAKEGERGTIATDLLPHLRRLCNLHS